jgi:Protein of unknown function (DUF3489)
VIHVLTAVITAKGESKMTSTSEEQTTLAASGPAQEPKPATKPSLAQRKPRVAPAPTKSGKKTTPAKKAPKGAKAAKPAKTESGARHGSKTEQVLELLKRPEGATLQNLMKATGWQAHSVRGFISGTIGKKMGLTVVSNKTESGERRYSIKA